MIRETNVKLNLGLQVLRKRPDGYHDLETLFLPYHGYSDTIEIITGDDFSHTSAALFAKYGEGSVFAHAREDTLAQAISEDGKLMITIARAEGVDWEPLDDLCAKAYRLLASDYDLPPVKIFVEKKAPVGAGLGGGSADAAFTLGMLNDMFGLGLPLSPDGSGKTSLSEYASRLGSDCAFFVFNRPMMGSGRGEVLEPYDIDLSGYDIQVLVPEGVAVSTKEAYSGVTPQDYGRENLRESLRRPIEKWKDSVSNDFEPSVFKVHPELSAIKRSLYDSGAVFASMSGSGSAIFALYRK